MFAATLCCCLLAAVANAVRVEYFAFGSNMHPRTMRTTRAIVPMLTARGVVEKHRLAFNLKGAGPEPSFASIEPCEDDETHGVLFSLALPDFARLCASEGVPLAYALQPVRVAVYGRDLDRWRRHRPISEDGYVEALTLRTTGGPWRAARDDEPRPSRRYLATLRDGARICALDPAWTARLDTMLRDDAARRV